MFKLLCTFLFFIILVKKYILKNILRSFSIHNSLTLLIDIFHFLNCEVVKSYVSNLNNVNLFKHFFNFEQPLDCNARPFKTI